VVQLRDLHWGALLRLEIFRRKGQAKGGQKKKEKKALNFLVVLKKSFEVKRSLEEKNWRILAAEAELAIGVKPRRKVPRKRTSDTSVFHT